MASRTTNITPAELDLTNVFIKLYDDLVPYVTFYLKINLKFILNSTFFLVCHPYKFFQDSINYVAPLPVCLLQAGDPCPSSSFPTSLITFNNLMGLSLEWLSLSHLLANSLKFTPLSW